ncbi:MAG: hypothetical protein ACTSR3_05830 [Candidatus Helarchaeota archaeon]
MNYEKELEKEIEELEQNWENHKDLHNEGGIIYFEQLKAKLEGYRKAKEEFMKKVEKLKDTLTPQLFHEIYEKQARRSGWETHKDCKLKPFDELPETNQETMIYTLKEIHKEIDRFVGEKN